MMSSPSSFLSFLRPLGLPRASTFQRFTVPRRYAGTAAINRRPSPKRINKAKTSFSEPIQPGKKHPKPSLPRPKKENAIGSRKIGAPASNRRRVTASPGVAAELTASTSPSAPASPPPEKIPSLLPYHVARTATNHLPIYLQAKRGGNLHQTLIRKISGKVNELKQELAKSLELEGQDAVVNPVTGHIVLKGWWKPQVQQFLEKRNF